MGWKARQNRPERLRRLMPDLGNPRASAERKPSRRLIAVTTGGRAYDFCQEHGRKCTCRAGTFMVRSMGPPLLGKKLAGAVALP